MAHLRRELTYSLRRLLKSPGLLVAVILSIGLGIAANATIFAMVSRFVLRPAPVGNPATLLAIHQTHEGDNCCNNFPYPQYQDVRDHTQSFTGVAAYYELLPASIGGHGEPERVWGQATSANFFDVAQLPMTLGRGFAENEETSDVIVLSDRLWRRRFAADLAIIGQAISVSGHRFTVVGVAPPGFRGLDFVLDPQFWIPLGHIEQFATSIPRWDSRSSHWLAVVGRLAPGVTRAQANSELAALAQHLAKQYPATDKGNGFLFTQAGSLPPRDQRAFLLFLAALSVVVLLVLAIACANVTNLLLAQAASRQREMAIRIALGATRRQLLGQMLLESMILALAGGVVGTGLALWATTALSAFHVPAPVPLDFSIAVDWRVILYTFALSVGAGFLFGLIPALIGSRPVLITALKGEDALARPGRRITLRNVLVVAQIAMSLVLLCATGLFLRSLQNASAIDIGFRSRGVLMVSVDPRVQGYTPERTAQFLLTLRERVAAIPGVLSVAATDAVPLAGGNRSDGFHVEGSNLEDPMVEMFMATPGYFDTMGIPRVAGRDFANETPDGPKVAVINRAFAEHYFAGKSAIGHRILDGGTPYEIIGVVGNIRSRTLGEDQRYVMFRSLAQTTASDPSFLGYQLVVHTAYDSPDTAQAVRAQIHALDASMAVYDVETMQEHLAKALFLPRIAGTLFGTFGVIGLTLAAVGLYGVISYSVSRRTREIGIRIALGSQRSAVRSLVLRQGMILTLLAVAIGLPAAYALSRFSASFLYGVQPHDAITFTLVPIVLAAIALTACWIPARKAAAVDPQTALRYE